MPVEVLELMSANKHVHNVLLKNYPGLAHSRSFSQPLTSSRHSNGSNPMPFESSLSPTSPNESGLAKTKSRRIRNEQAFLTWLKEDPHIHHAKDVRIIMVNLDNIFLCTHLFNLFYFLNRFILAPKPDGLFEGLANASTLSDLSWCNVEHQSLSVTGVLMPGYLSKFDDHNR